jgi:hypothetical protein
MKKNDNRPEEAVGKKALIEITVRRFAQQFSPFELHKRTCKNFQTLIAET